MTYGNKNSFPFNNCNNKEIININNCDYLPKDNIIINNLPNYKISEQAIKASNFNNQYNLNSDVNLSNLLGCKYYSCDDFHNLKFKNNHHKNVNIFHNNFNGLESKFDEFHSFLSCTPFNLDIITITETSQLNNSNDSNFKKKVDIKGYTLNSLATNTSKGGVAIYTKNKFVIIERHDLNITNDHFECLWIEIKNKNCKNIVVASIYRHPHDTLDVYNSFLDYLENTLIKLIKENKELYICGDFNSDMLKTDVDVKYSRFYETLSSYGLVPFILLPTRITETSATIVDNIFTNNMTNTITSGNITTNFSDHFSQFISVNRPKIDYKEDHIYRRDYTNFSEQSFRDDVSLQHFNNEFTDVNDQFNDFFFKLEGSVNRHAPYKKLTSKEVKLEQKPWITKNILKMIKIKNKIFNRKKRQPNNENIIKLYKLFRNRVNRELIKSKKEYYNQFFEDNKKDNKKVWEGIKSIININNNKSKNISQLNINDKIIDNPKDIVETLNNFFVNVGPNTEKCIPHNPIIKPEKYLKNKNLNKFQMNDTTEDEIMDIINQLESKSSGPNSIPVNLLKIIADIIVVPLCVIVNNSFSSGVFPDALKLSKVVPIHKGESTLDPNNYRPISLLPIFDKIIEKLMHKQLYCFLNSHNILFENQFGFRKNSSTSFALMQIIETIKETIDNKKYGCGIFIDLRKAFDTVNHEILLNKLDHYGIRGIALNWFKSYLFNRKQYVFHNGESSQYQNINSGVPQGSVLGPLLFLLYINDLPNISNVFKFFLFADDTNIYYEADTPDKLEKVINKELKKLRVWLIVNRLSLNIDKTNFVVFHPYNKPLKQKITLKIHKSAIKEKDCVKYLGILIDSTLTWKDHINNVIIKISKALGLLYKIRHYVNIKIMRMLYFSLVYPHLIYGIEVWGSADITFLNRIFILQKRIVRMITFTDKRLQDYSLLPSEPLFFKLNIYKIHDIYKLMISKFIFNCLKKTNPVNFNSWFKLTSHVHNHNTRSKFIDIDNTVVTRTLFIPLVRTTYYGLKSLKVQGPKIWNSLPPLLRNIDNVNSFIKQLKKYFISLYYN